MKVQVLVAALNQSNHSLLERMNIQSDVIVGNQCDENSIEKFIYNGFSAIYLNFSERGVGLNRNNALMRADADYCLFADDYMVYIDNYPQIVINAFNKNPKADILIFNIKEKKSSRYVITKKTKVGYLNYLRYGTARIAIKLEKVKNKGIYFNQCFGGGTEHCHGEDNIFLSDCLKEGLKIYAVPITIAELKEDRKSTWNNGYDKKYLAEQGCLYKTISHRLWKLLCLQDALRRSKRDYKMSWYAAYKTMVGRVM